MGWLSDFYDAIVDAIASLFGWILEKLLQALAAVLSLIPVPGWLNEAAPAIQNMFNVFGWGLSIGQFDFGLAVMFSALIIRFSIRRLPFIGG